MATAIFSYSTNYLIETDHGVTVYVEATRSIRQAEVWSTKTMLKRVKDTFDLHPERLIADTAYRSGPMLGWLVDRKINPNIPVIDKARRPDGTWPRIAFEWDAGNNQYICPEREAPKQFRHNYSDPNRGPSSLVANINPALVQQIVDIAHDPANRMLCITARRMISGLVLKQRKGQC